MRRSPGWGAVEERKLDSARPAMVSARGALPVVLAQRRGGESGSFSPHRWIPGPPKGGAAGDSVPNCQLGYKWLARLADSWFNSQKSRKNPSTLPYLAICETWLIVKTLHVSASGTCYVDYFLVFLAHM